MKEMKVRLIYPPSVNPQEAGAAIKGIERFRTFGVLCDSAVLGGNDKAALQGVKNGRTVRRIITSPEPQVQFYDLGGDLSELFFTKDVIPVGLTPSPLSEVMDGEFSSRKEPRVGVSRSEEGAIVSLFRARELKALETGMAGAPFRVDIDAGLAGKSITMAVTHELGHVFGLIGHCRKDSCVMQENKNFPDFIDRFVREGLDFCRDCSSTISGNVCRMMTGF